ncbi:DinB family protein [Kocuria sp. M1R5S2]|uniref:DinB family protein n=1 Tax=Kocuria rhizosphaerae TaxID=3376285 RepID=UPI00379EF71D
MDEAADIRRTIHLELDRARDDFHALVAAAGPADLRRRSAGTRWTNGQLLFHMYFGHLVVRRLLPLVRLLGRLPPVVGRVFSRVLDAGTRPFHVINHLGSCGGALVVRGPRLTRWFDRTVDVLHDRIEHESADALARGMHFPVHWDPYFQDWMSLADVYRYAAVHYDHHRRQLTLHGHS